MKLSAIDEISSRKGHIYITIVMDLESGAIIFVGKGKGQEALKPFWKRLSASKTKIKAAATHMSSAYYAAVQKHLPSAILVFDRFHIVKLMNEKLSHYPAGKCESAAMRGGIRVICQTNCPSPHGSPHGIISICGKSR